MFFNLIKTVKAMVITVIMTGGIGAVYAGELLNTNDGVAMDGFDVVAYFKDNAPAKGTTAHTVDYKGSVWQFSSADNAQAFQDNPVKYAPQNNGWCAYAVSEGVGAEVDFVNGWTILDDKLYMNWNEATKDSFVAEQTRRIPLAEQKWPEVHAGLQDGSVELYLHKDDAGAGISHPQHLNQ